MYEQINKELEQLQQCILRQGKIVTMLSSLELQLKMQEDKKLRYEKELKKEQLDVEKINKTNLTTLFYTILGSKEEQIEKERQELLSAQLKYNDIQRQIDDTKYQIYNLQAEQKEYENCKNNYNILFQKKYKMLMENHSINAVKITNLEKNISLYKANIKEIDEAIAAGNQAADKLRETEGSLDSAEGWGMWDLLGGGGLVTDMIKHSHIDDAKTSASEVQSLLNQFNTELADVRITSQINIEIDGFTKFADFFFDGLIADWVVQSRINNSLESVNEVKEQVNSVLSKLQQLKDSDMDNLNKMEKELSDLIARV